MLQKDWGVSEHVEILIYEKNFVSSDNPGQKKLTRRKSGKTGQDQKTLISPFA